MDSWLVGSGWWVVGRSKRETRNTKLEKKRVPSWELLADTRQFSYPSHMLGTREWQMQGLEDTEDGRTYGRRDIGAGGDREILGWKGTPPVFFVSVAFKRFSVSVSPVFATYTGWL